ncbi:SDR family NAD(P)-dependent oxidoreductase [Vibrio mediterranei]|uniref:SDR family NAD(P)-dependent oxidoreductase n=1 Tax=Vibrio mediterranei TaxID=689 RepID=UPI004068AB51
MKKKKWALVTGGAGGIGKSLVEEFTEAGYIVIAVDKAFENSVSISKTVYNLHIDLEQVAKSESYTNQFVQKIQEITNGHGIDCLINNAAVQILASCTKLTRTNWQTTLDVNLSAPFFLSQSFASALTKNKGAIVNISSIHATQTKKEFAAYATSKAALSALTRNMVLDLGTEIRINAIEPAAIATEMLKAGFNGKPDQYAELESFHPVNRIGQPKEVAELAVFLCSDKANFVQGACISASGGISNSLSDPK